MLKNIIIIENDKEVQCDNFEDMVKVLIDKEFYDLKDEERKKKLKILALANKFEENEEYVLENEVTYILSLLINYKIILLERKESNILTKDLDKSNLNGNYIIVNKFAKCLLKKYMNKGAN